MSGRINLFTPSIGIAGVATPRQEKLSLKKRGHVSPALHTSRAKEDLSLYDGENMDSMLDEYLRVTPDDPDTASPENFGRAVQEGLKGLHDATGDEILGEMLKEFNENSDLLRMYSSLVLGG